MLAELVDGRGLARRERIRLPVEHAVEVHERGEPIIVVLAAVRTLEVGPPRVPSSIARVRDDGRAPRIDAKLLTADAQTQRVDRRFLLVLANRLPELALLGVLAEAGARH